MPNPDLEIRGYRSEDLAQVIALWQRCKLIVPWNDPYRDIEDKVDWQPELFLVGLLDGELVATAMVGYEGHRGWINYLAVAPAYQRRDYGRQMMAAAEDRLGALRCPKINLQVRASNSGVIAFYRSLGYQTDEVISLGKRLPTSSKNR